MNQHLIDYTVRNITTGDEEELRVLELEADEFDGFPETVRDEIRGLVIPLAIRIPRRIASSNCSRHSSATRSSTPATTAHGNMCCSMPWTRKPRTSH